MIEIKVNKTLVKIYKEVDELPIERFNKANKFWMLHDNIGSSIEDIDKNHFSKLYMIAGDEAKTKKELNNLRILIYNIINEVNVNHLSFACLVYSIKGEERNDLSDEGLKRTLKELSDLGLTQNVLKKKLTALEKQSMKN